MAGRTTRRGYGTQHQRTRARWAPLVAAGKVTCARCDQKIQPGTPWDLGHDDEDRTRYSGPEHRACNRATGTHRVERQAAQEREATDRPRRYSSWCADSSPMPTCNGGDWCDLCRHVRERTS